MVKIEKGIPMPMKRKALFDTYLRMEVGDSFVVGIDQHRTIRTYASKWKLLIEGTDYVCKKINDKEVRVWRIN